MQKKIDSFFKPSSATKSSLPTSNMGDLFDKTRVGKQSEILIKYTRERQSVSGEDGALSGKEKFEEQREESEKLKVVSSKGKVLNKKRSYAQLHLELGQSDFLLHTCKTCGINYAKGDETDEKVHRTFHKNYTHGIPFKGWCQERVIHVPSLERDRIILVLNCDPLSQRKKVQEVVKMMEIELGDGWIFHELCKVYMFISSQRIAGCMVVEPINTAHKILLNPVDKISDDSSGKEAMLKPSTLQFGEICFQREFSRKGSSRGRSETVDSNSMGSIVCEEVARPASCGIRAIWVSLANRRKHIATHLLDALRKSFCPDYVLERSELAFSQPTTAGKALASKYTGTRSFLVYRT